MAEDSTATKIEASLLLTMDPAIIAADTSAGASQITFLLLIVTKSARQRNR
jgi:hypothetical protein